MKHLFRTLSMQVTYQCNIECKHCGPYCGPKEKDWMTIPEIKNLIKQAEELGVYNVVFTGGEPTLLKENLIYLLEYIKNETTIQSTRIVTNAKWASTYDVAFEKLKKWQDAGLDELNISCGEYHQEFVPLEYVINAYRAASDLNFTTVLLAGEFINPDYATITPKDFENALGEKLLNPEEFSPYITKYRGMSTGCAMAYGRGVNFITPEMMIYRDESEIPSICTDVLSVLTVHPNGNTTACCGVMTRDESLLNMGNWRNSTLEDIIRAGNNDLILNWIRFLGLKDMRNWILEKDPSIKLNEKFTCICDICTSIVYDSKCQKILVEHGSERRDDIITNKIAHESTIYSDNFVSSVDSI